MLQGEEISLIEGDIFGEFKISSTKINKKEVKLLAPISPPNIINRVKLQKHAEESGKDCPDKLLYF